MVMVFLQLESIWVILATRSGQGHVKNSKILKCLILKNKTKQRPVSDAEWPQDSNGAICFSVRGLKPPKNLVWLYDVTVSRHVAEINLAFGVKNRGIDLKFWAVVGVGYMFNI